MIILQSVTDVSGASELCLGYLALGGILFLGVALGFAICTVLSRNPKANLDMNLISNAKALELINNFKENSKEGDAVSGHLEEGVLVSYMDKMKTACTTAGKTFSGLEYYFAKYGDTDISPNQNTIVLYPTYIEGTDHIPFDPSLNTSVRSLNTDYNVDNAIPANLTTAKYTSNYALNRTHMSPPREPLTL